MAKKAVVAVTEAAEPVAEVEAPSVVEGPYILVEAPDGSGAYRLDVPAEVGLERVLSVGGVSYEHCADQDGRWVYRASR